MSDRSAEAVAYGIAIAVLVVGGMFWRTMVLNWFVGPMVVVLVVGLVMPVLQRRRVR